MAIYKLDTGILGEDFNVYQIRNNDVRSFTPKNSQDQSFRTVEDQGVNGGEVEEVDGAEVSRLALGCQRGQGECQRRCQVGCQMIMGESEGSDGCQKGLWMGDGGCNTVDVECVAGAETEGRGRQKENLMGKGWRKDS